MDFNTQDTASLDSFPSSRPPRGAAFDNDATMPPPEDLFTVLSLLAGMRRTWYLTMRHGWRLSRWTCLTASPSFVVALVTALSWHDDRRRRDDVDDAHSTLTPFQELRQALPLVLWHVTWLTLGAVTALAVVIRYVAETVYDDDDHHSHGGRQRQRKVVTTTSWRVSVMTALTRHGGVLTAAGTFVVGSCAVVYVVGHVLTVGLRDLRRDAQSAHDKNPLVFGSIACASWIMTVAVDVTVVFVVVWMACMYGFAVPVIVLERNVDDDRDDNTNVPVEVFRKAYVLARDSRSYLVASWTGAVWIPATVVTLLAVTWPLHAVTTRWPGRDYVDWQLGTIPGVVALYAPLMILWLPLCGIHQTVLYVTLRVLKDGLTADVFRGDLERTAPPYTLVQATDAVPLTLGPAASYDDDVIGEDEFDGHHNDTNNNNNNNNAIEMSAIRK